MQRFLALDIFRGMTICLMIIVNTSGDWSVTFSPLLHANWHGITATDLVFPSFLFAVGNAFAFVKMKWAGKTFSQVLSKILKRTAIIFLLGYTMYWLPFVKWTDTGDLAFVPFSETRILGVLQRIALCYFFAAVLIYNLSKKGLWIASAALLLIYWGLMAAFGDYSLEHNFARTLDRWILGDGHLYMGEGIPFDPEGILSTLPSIVNILAGYLAGIYIIQGGLNYEKLAKLLLAGCGLLFLSYVWNFGFPINKKLWTSSYVLTTVGIDLVVLSVIIYTTDFIKRPFQYRFFEIFGKNPLAIYLLSEYLAIALLFIRVDGEKSLYRSIYENAFSWLGPYWGAFAFAFVFMLLCWLVGWWMDRKKIYIRV